LLAFHDDFIVVTIEGQRIAPDGAMRSVSDHRRASRKYKLGVGRCIDEFLARGATACLLNDDVIRCNDLI
jgi:hypothetical protein